MSNVIREIAILHYISSGAETLTVGSTKTTPWQRIRRHPVATDLTATTLPVVWERRYLRGVVFALNPGLFQVQFSPDGGNTIFQMPPFTKAAGEALAFNVLILSQFVRVSYTDQGQTNETQFVLHAMIEEPIV